MTLSGAETVQEIPLLSRKSKGKGKVGYCPKYVGKIFPRKFKN